MTALRAHAGDVEIVHLGCVALLCLAVEEENCVPLVREGAGAALAAALRARLRWCARAALRCCT